jgi:hypothetical protein
LGIIIPTNDHIFQRGRYTTNQIKVGEQLSRGLEKTQTLGDDFVGGSMWFRNARTGIQYN